MRLNGVRRFWVALAILPLIGGVALASGPAMFVCRGDAVARTACCCPDHHQPRARLRQVSRPVAAAMFHRQTRLSLPPRNRGS